MLQVTGNHSETSPTFLHVSERRIAEAVRAERVALATGPRRPQHQLKVIEGTAELLVQFDGSVLGETVGLITVGAVEPAGFSLQIHFSVKHFSSYFNDKTVCTDVKTSRGFTPRHTTSINGTSKST